MGASNKGAWPHLGGGGAVRKVFPGGMVFALRSKRYMCVNHVQLSQESWENLALGLMVSFWKFCPSPCGQFSIWKFWKLY